MTIINTKEWLAAKPEDRAALIEQGKIQEEVLTQAIPSLNNRESKMLNIKEALKHRDNLDEVYSEDQMNALFDYCVCNKGQCDELPCISDIDFK